MGKEEKKDILEALEHYITDIVDGRIAYHIKQNRHNTAPKGVSLPFSEKINIVLPLGWHPEKIEKLKIFHRYLLCFGIITCDYPEFETHFIGSSKGKTLWIGTQTELMYLISELIDSLKLIPPTAKNNLNIIISGHFRDLDGDYDPEILKVSKSKGIGKKDRLDIFNEITDALK
jgi:hypothetical protein